MKLDDIKKASVDKPEIATSQQIEVQPTEEVSPVETPPIETPVVVPVVEDESKADAPTVDAGKAPVIAITVEPPHSVTVEAGTEPALPTLQITGDEDKDNKTSPTKPGNQSYHDSKLSAPEVAQKYFVPRPKNRIATKNISFSKSKNKKPKYGLKGSSPRSAGMSPHPSELESTEGERRHLPSRKSRPQQLLDEEPAPAGDLQSDELLEDISSQSTGTLSLSH